MSLLVNCSDIYERYKNLTMDENYHFTGAGILVYTCEVLMWIVGILGNLVNVVVFTHKTMVNRPINLIFWWLSVSDLLELVILALYQWHWGWSGWIDIITTYVSRKSIHDCLLFLIYMYLVQVIHTITIGLNIVLVFCQYMAVAHPLMNQKNPFNDVFIKFAVIWTYVLSFVLYLPFWYIHEIYTDDRGSKSWRIHQRGQQSGGGPHISKDPLVNLCIIICGIILRIGPLIILIILCIMLLFAIRNAHRNRQNLGTPASHLSEAQRSVNRMNVTIAVIIIMFLITEVTLALSSLSMLSWSSFSCSIAIYRIILLPLTLLNCCYNIFCYLFRIEQYREILKLLLSKSYWVRSRARV